MPELREGDAIGPYVLERAIDKGAFGRVWRAVDPATGRVVAIKLLATNGSSEEHAKARTDLERLAAAAARDSRHIVHVLAGGLKPVPHIVMEFVDGTNLREELSARGPMPQEEVIRIGLEIADALRALHRVRIVHRDVKPANILLDQQGEVRLTDFGIAKILGYDETVTLTQQNLLSAPYAAPEVWEGAPNPSSDIYAFGSVLFEMLAGRPPFQGDLMDLFRKHRVEDADLSHLPAHTAPALRELIYQCLRKTAAERPADADACVRLLERARQELRREPERFGPWVRLDLAPEEDWTWRCRHERTAEEARVEVHFGEDEAYGEALRSAVAVNPKLTPFGAETLLGMNRLLLADEEGWPTAPDHNVAFWVARGVEDVPEPAVELDRPQLLRATESFARMIEAASGGGVRLSIDPERATVAADGSVFLGRPGLPPAAPVEPRLGAFMFLRSLALTPEAAEAAARARDLRDLRERLARPPAAKGEAREETGLRRGLMFIGLGLVAIAVAIVAGFLIASSEGDRPAQVVASPTSLPAPPACGDLKLPAGLKTAASACAAGGPVSVDYSADCARGQVCRVEAAAAGVVLKANDQTIAFVDSNGDLYLGRESDLSSERLLLDGKIRQPAWSPDGHYLAYVVAKPAGEATTTELWVVDTQEPGSSALVFTSSDASSTPAGQRRRIAQPAWSADGKHVYFRWKPATGPDEVWSVELPVRQGAIDIRELRVWNGAPKNLSSSSTLVESQPVRFASFSALPDGALLAEYCIVKDGACGLGRWDGAGFEVIKAAEAGASFVSPLVVGDRILALRIDGADVVLVGVANATVTPIARLPATIGPGPIDSDDLSLTISADGTRVLAGTAAGLKFVSLSDGGVTPALDGRWAAWFSPPSPAAGVSPPPATPFATPGSTPSAPPAATIPPGGDADLVPEIVAATCASGQTLTIRIRNLGPSTVDRVVLVRVSATADGATRQGNTDAQLGGLKPGEDREVRTSYVVREPVQVSIEYARDRRNDNNVVTCTPR